MIPVAASPHLTSRLTMEDTARMIHHSSWSDVAAKSKRLVQSGNVTILRNAPHHIMSHVVGDHGNYQCEISRADPRSQVIESWSCECPWNQFAFDRTRSWKKLEGRPCFLGSTQVAMADGTFKPISEVRPGESILTTDGVGIVGDLWTSDYDGLMRRIYRVGSPFPIEATADHGFPTAPGASEHTSSAFQRERRWVLDRASWARAEAQELSVGDWLEGSYPIAVEPFVLDVESLSPHFHSNDDERVYKSVYAKGNTRLERQLTLSRLQSAPSFPDDVVEMFHANIRRDEDCWIWQGPVDPNTKSNRIHCGGKSYGARTVAWALAGRDKGTGRRLMNQCGNTLCVSPDHLRTNEKKSFGQRAVQTLPVRLDASMALATILGWYLAEGSIENNGNIVAWTISAEEDHVVTALQEALDELGAGELRIYPDNNRITVKVSNAVLACVVQYLCGSGSRNKCLHGSIMLAECDFQQRLLDCYLEGDGNVDKRGVTYVNTASDALARQLVLLGARLTRVVPAHSRGKNRGGPTRRDASDLTINRIVFGRKKMHGRIAMREGYYAVRVSRVEKFHHTGLVYNLNVIPQHTYNVEGVSCFNCSHVLATYWKAKSVPLDLEDHPELQQEGYAPAGQRVRPFTDQEMFDQNAGQLPGVSEQQADLGNLPRSFSPDDVATPSWESIPEMRQRIIDGQQPQQEPQSASDMVAPPPPSNPFSTPRRTGPRQPQRDQLELFDLTAPPGGQPLPPQSPVSIPGLNPPGWQNPGNPTQFPGTFSHVTEETDTHTGTPQPFFIVNASEFHWAAADDIETWFNEMKRLRQRPIFQLRNTVMLEASGGKIPVPGAEPIGESQDGLPQYRTLDLGWDPQQQRRVNQNEVHPSGQVGSPAQTDMFGEVRAGRRGEVVEIEPLLKMVYVHIPINDSGPLHHHLFKGWLNYSDIAPIAGAPTPFRKRR